MKKLKTKFLTVIFQYFADSIIRNIEKAKDEAQLERLYKMGLGLNQYCINKFGIYLK